MVRSTDTDQERSMRGAKNTLACNGGTPLRNCNELHRTARWCSISTSPEDVESGESVGLYAVLITLLSVSIILLLEASLLWLSAKFLRFRKPSFWTSLGCVVIAFAVAWVAEKIVFLAISFPDSTRHTQIPWQAVLVIKLAAGGFGAVAGVISVALLFREPVWKAITAIGLVLAVEALLEGLSFIGALFWWLFSWFPHHML